MTSVTVGTTEIRGQKTSPWSATAAATVGLIFGPSTILIFLFGVFVAPLEREFGWSRPEILFAATIVSLMIMVISPIQGYLIDRFGARPIVLFSTVTFAAGLLGLALIPGEIRFFYFLYAILPLLAIGLWPVSYLRVVSTWFDKRLGLAIGIANGGIGIGTSVLPLFATYLMTVGTWRAAYVGVAAIILAVTLPLNIWFLREAPRPETPGLSKVGSLTGLPFREISRSRTFLLLVGAFFFLGFVNTGLVANQISLLIDSGSSPTRAALVQSVFGIAVLLGRFATGALLDHYPAKRIMMVVCAGGAIACLMYAAGVTNDLVFVCAVLIGAIFGAEFDVLSYVVKRYFGMAAFGLAYGTVFAVFQLGAAIGATLLPLSRSYSGSYAMGLQIYAAALAISILLFALIGPYLFDTSRLGADSRSQPNDNKDS
jgi:MFS family permease